MTDFFHDLKLFGLYLFGPDYLNLIWKNKKWLICISVLQFLMINCLMDQINQKSNISKWEYLRQLCHYTKYRNESGISATSSIEPACLIFDRMDRGSDLCMFPGYSCFTVYTTSMELSHPVLTLHEVSREIWNLGDEFYRMCKLNYWAHALCLEILKRQLDVMLFFSFGRSLVIVGLSVVRYKTFLVSERTKSIAGHFVDT
jgi:hypothetical protein